MANPTVITAHSAAFVGARDPHAARAMYIEEVCIDGFKSYAKRTVVPGFDPLFNAITGLNGSGKSNILDSICFVLGISNLTHGGRGRGVGGGGGGRGGRGGGGREG